MGENDQSTKADIYETGPRLLQPHSHHCMILLQFLLWFAGKSLDCETQRTDLSVLWGTDILNGETVCIMFQNSLKKFAAQLWEWLQIINQGPRKQCLCEAFFNPQIKQFQAAFPLHAAASVYMWLASQFSLKSSIPFSLNEEFAFMSIFLWHLKYWRSI